MDDVGEYFLGPPHGTTPTAVIAKPFLTVSDEKVKVSVNDFIIKSAAIALQVRSLTLLSFYLSCSTLSRGLCAAERQRKI